MQFQSKNKNEQIMVPSKLTPLMVKRIYSLSKERNSPSEIRRIISKEFEKVSTTFVHYIIRDIENNKFKFKRRCKCCNGSGHEELKICIYFLKCDNFDDNNSCCINLKPNNETGCKYYNNFKI